MSVDRRTVLKATATVAAAGPFAGLVAAPAEARKPPRTPPTWSRSRTSATAWCACTCRAGSTTARSTTPTPAGQSVVLTDGTRLPGRHDGMGAFAGPDDTVVLVRNHEITNNPNAPAFGPGTPYDANAGAGTTTIQVTKQGKPIRSFTSLNGTMFNCSGGQMPWGAWVTCEETVNGPDVGPDFTGASNTGLQKPHGFVFEVPASHLPGRGSPRGSRSATPGGSRTRRSRSTRSAATSTSPRTTSGSRPASTATRRPRNPMVVGRLEDGGTLQMLRVTGVAQRAPRGAAGQRHDVRRRSGSTSTSRGVRTPLRRAGDDHQRPGPDPRGQPGLGPGCGVLLPARGPGLRRRRRLLHLHPGRRSGGGRARRQCPRRQRLRPRLRPGLGLRHPHAEAAGGVPVPGPR